MPFQKQAIFLQYFAIFQRSSYTVLTDYPKKHTLNTHTFSKRITQPRDHSATN